MVDAGLKPGLLPWQTSGMKTVSSKSIHQSAVTSRSLFHRLEGANRGTCLTPGESKPNSDPCLHTEKTARDAGIEYGTIASAERSDGLTTLSPLATSSLWYLTGRIKGSCLGVQLSVVVHRLRAAV